MAACLLIIVVLVGESAWQCQDPVIIGDESSQAVTGLYFADFLVDLPLTHPLEYTYRYYAQYPALGLVHWPPMFQFAEGVAFLVGGRSFTTARVTVLLFLIVGLAFWFALVRDLLNPIAAAFCTLLLVLLPPIFFYSHAIMLVIPSLALAIIASFFWVRCLRTGNANFLYGAAAFSSFALLTYEHAIFLLPFFILSLLIEPKRWRLLLSGRFWTALLIPVVTVVPFYVLVLKTHGRTMVAHVVHHRAYRISDFTYYPKALVQQAGWPVLILALSGAIVMLFVQKSRYARWMFLWAAGCYVALTFMAAKESRYALFWLPAVVYFACWPLTVRWSNRWSRVAAVTLCSLVFVTYGFGAISPQNSNYIGVKFNSYARLSGYSDLARFLTAPQGKGEVVLVDDFWDGNLIFYMRAQDPRRRFVILRKALYVTNIIPLFGQHELLHTRDDLRRLLEQYGIKHIVISDDRASNFPIQKVLRDLVTDPQFKLAATFPVVDHRTGKTLRRLYVYENLRAAAPTADNLHIRMMTIGRDIVVPLKDLGIK